MPALRIAAQTRSLAGSLKKALHMAAELGCDGVQIEARHELRPAELSETGARQLRKLLDDLNLRVGSIAFPTRRGYAEPADLERRLDATRAAMRLASMLHCRVLLCSLGSVPAEESDQERRTLVDAITSLSNLGNRTGVQLVAQASEVDLDLLARFVSSLPEGTLGLDLHPAHLITLGLSPSQFIASVGSWIAHVHASDGVYDLSNRRGVEVELGRGTADVPQLLGMLEEHEYRGWLTIQRSDSPNVISDIANAVRFLRSL